MKFFHFADLPFWTNPRRHAFYSVKHMVFTHSSLSKKTFFHKPIFWNILFVRSVFASMFHHFSRLFRHWFLLSFFHGCFMKTHPKMAPKMLVLVYLFRILFASFRGLPFYIDFMLILAPFCHSFGSLWHTLGHLWLPFGSLSVSFGSLLVPLGSLLPTLALHFLTLGASLFHFSYLYAFSMKFSCFFYSHWNSDRCFLCLLSRPFQQSTRRQYQGPRPSHL